MSGIQINLVVTEKEPTQIITSSSHRLTPFNESLGSSEHSWTEMTCWLQRKMTKSKKENTSVILSTYVNIPHGLHKVKVKIQEKRAKGTTKTTKDDTTRTKGMDVLPWTLRTCF